MNQSDRCNHRIRAANRLSCSLQIAIDAARNLSAVLVERQNLAGFEPFQQLLDSIFSSHFLKAFDYLHQGDHRSGKLAEAQLVGSGPRSYYSILSLKDLRNNICV